MDLDKRKTELNSQIKLFRRLGVFFGILAIVPLVWAVIQVFQAHSFFKENELGDFIGGTSGTFASFAGLAFVYIGFLGQQLQILMQQEELEMNRQELKDTREEIKGQKVQLELQNKFNSETQTKNTFFKLLDSLILTRAQLTYLNLIDYDRDLARFKEDTKNFPSTDLSKHQPKQKIVKEDAAFENILYKMKEWSRSQWKSNIPSGFFELNNYHYLPKRSDFTFENTSIEEIAFIIRAVSDEKSLGAYLRILPIIIHFSVKSNLSDELKVLDALMGKYERIYCFYWLYGFRPFEKMDEVQNFELFQSVSPKHLLFKNHKNLLLGK